MSSRYEPRRRAGNPSESHPHRLAKRRRRAGLFAFALAITVLVGAAGIGMFSDPRADTTASASDVGTSAVETSELAVVKAPKPKPVGKPATDLAATDLAAKVQAGTDALPKDSGSGRRVVFSKSEQRVWLVNLDGNVDRTYKVSGSIHDNLNAGTYAVESHTRYATSYDYTSHMEYFVRFATGKNAPIGFHDIPVANAGALVQTIDQLGTPLSSGCIRQARPDAIRLWDFAPVGTAVVVLA